MLETCISGSMRGMWKRSYGQAIKAPPDERGGNTHARPNTTASHPYSTKPTHADFRRRVLGRFRARSTSESAPWSSPPAAALDVRHPLSRDAVRCATTRPLIGLIWPKDGDASIA
jgi:hypothetical protein